MTKNSNQGGVLPWCAQLPPGGDLSTPFVIYLLILHPRIRYPVHFPLQNCEPVIRWKTAKKAAAVKKLRSLYPKKKAVNFTGDCILTVCFPTGEVRVICLFSVFYGIGRLRQQVIHSSWFWGKVVENCAQKNRVKAPTAFNISSSKSSRHLISVHFWRPSL